MRSCGEYEGIAATLLHKELHWPKYIVRNKIQCCLEKNPHLGTGRELFSRQHCAATYELIYHHLYPNCSLTYKLKLKMQKT